MNTTRPRLPLVVALIGIGLPALIVYTVRQSSGRSMPRQALRPSDAGLSATSASPAATTADTSTPGPRSDLWQTIRSDMFSRGMSASPVISPPAAPLVETAVPILVATTPANDPLADYVYNGTVMVDGEMSALIEHRKSKQGWYVNEGDRWQDYRILAIDARQITVEVNGESRTLTKSDDINVVPLASNAGQTAPTAANSYLNAFQAIVDKTAADNAVQISLVSSLGNAINQSLSGMELDNLKMSLDNAQIRLNQDSASNLGTISINYISTQ